VPSPAPALLQLRAQLDARYPHRSRASDGIMGDAAHKLRRSAHNLGDAFDVTEDFANGPNLPVLVAELCRQMRANPDGRLALIIYERRKYRARDGWRGVRYLGPNPHTLHAHLEVRHSHRAIVRPWTLP